MCCSVLPLEGATIGLKIAVLHQLQCNQLMLLAMCYHPPISCPSPHITFPYHLPHLTLPAPAPLSGLQNSSNPLFAPTSPVHVYDAHCSTNNCSMCRIKASVSQGYAGDICTVQDDLLSGTTWMVSPLNREPFPAEPCGQCNAQLPGKCPPTLMTVLPPFVFNRSPAHIIPTCHGLSCTETSAYSTSMLSMLRRLCFPVCVCVCLFRV